MVKVVVARNFFLLLLNSSVRPCLAVAGLPVQRRDIKLVNLAKLQSGRARQQSQKCNKLTL